MTAIQILARAHQPGVQGRLRHRHRVGVRPAGPERGRRPPDLRQEGRAGVASRVAPQGLPPLAHDERADLAERPLPADRLPGDRLLLGAQARKDGPKSLDEVDPKLLETYEKLGIPLRERAKLAGVAVDAVFDSVSVATTFREQAREGRRHLLLVLGGGAEPPRAREEVPRARSCPYTDNFFATLNSAVFSDGSFVYIPKGVRCPMELSTYFRINAANTGQFERTLIIADEGAYVSYLEGCTAPMRDENQLHAAVVELVALDDARDQVLDGPELVPRRQGRQGRHLQLRDQARQVPRAAARRSPGRRSRPAPRSPGSTRAASSRATTRSASSTRSR